MQQKFTIHKCDPMLPKRPCLYCLSLNGGCVFADFNLHGDELYIVRISFDGYGCYTIEDKTWTVDRRNTKRIIGWIESNNVNHDEMRAVLTEYFGRRNTADFDDALTHNGLPA